jgi:hypothetical protein
MRFLVPTILALVSLATTIPAPQAPEAGAVCGRNDYTTAEIKAAANTACQRLRAGTTVGSNRYPHEFRNEEGFEFDAPAPVFEFPILDGRVYKGGK